MKQRSSRLKNSVLNSIAASSVQIFNILLKFIVQTVFIHQLGAVYLGINGLFVNILSILSFAELGIGTAITYSLYKPLAENDQKAITGIMNYFKKAYNYIGFFVAILGMALLPFLPYLIGKTQIPLKSIYIIYILYLLNSVVSYFFTYKRTLLIADQKGYISVINQLLFSIIQIVIQIIILFLFKSYLGYLVTQILCTIFSNIVISNKVNKVYGFLGEYKDEKITSIERKTIKKNTIGMMGSKVGGIVVNGTDNLVISSFVGVVWVGLYSNYFLIVNSVSLVLTQLVTSISASIGNLVVLEKNTTKQKDIYSQHNYINLILILFSSSMLINLLNPFINIWIGREYLLSNFTVIIIVLNFIVTQSRQTAITFITSFGLFSRIGIKSILEAFSNLILSLIFVAYFKLGVAGVLLGTMISNVLINMWYEPYIVYKYGFKTPLTVAYFFRLIGYILLILVNVFTSFFITTNLPQTIMYLFIRICISFLFSMIIFVIFFMRFKPYKQIINRIKLKSK